MTAAWIRRLAGLAILLVSLWGVGGAVAQPDEPPPLVNVAADETGLLALFYPADWTLYEPQARIIIVSEEPRAAGGPDTQIFVRAQIIEPAPATAEEVRPWLLARLGLPPQTPAESQTYRGYPGWLAQGADLRAEGVYSAAVGLFLAPGRVALVRADFPSDQLLAVAPTLTAMFESVAVLPQALSAQQDTLRLHLPAEWPSSDGLEAVYAAPNPDALRAIARDEAAPQPYGLALRFLTGIDSREDYLAGLASLLQDEETFLADGRSITIQIRRDETRQQSELLIFRQAGLEGVLELRAVALTAEPLLAALDTLKAIFTNARLQ